ncbi:unnamed protein product [Pedinophyceae sp. YPF-701]|nr:unnamed protein product [Pedinophyceae sp. YPF-701]
MDGGSESSGGPASGSGHAVAPTQVDDDVAAQEVEQAAGPSEAQVTQAEAEAAAAATMAEAMRLAVTTEQITANVVRRCEQALAAVDATLSASYAAAADLERVAQQQQHSAATQETTQVPRRTVARTAVAVRDLRALASRGARLTAGALRTARTAAHQAREAANSANMYRSQVAAQTAAAAAETRRIRAEALAERAAAAAPPATTNAAAAGPTAGGVPAPGPPGPATPSQQGRRRAAGPSRSRSPPPTRQKR